jgi:hypothetical protein
MSIKYTYSTSVFTTSAGVVDLTRLTEDIQLSDITVALGYINKAGSTCDTWFKAALSGAELITLSGVLAAHTGEPLVDAGNVRLVDEDMSRITEVDDQGRLKVTIDYEIHDHDDLYYTEDEVDTISGTLQYDIDNHLHEEGDITDLDKYTQAEVDALIASASGTTDHSALDNLDYASSGHTGFASTAALTSTSGVLQDNIEEKSDLDHIHDDRYYTETEIDDMIITDHGSLDGLSDDDHTQYLLADGTRQLTDTWDFGSETISGTGNFHGTKLDIDYIDFEIDLLSNPISKTGRLFWDKDNHCLAVYESEYDVITQIAQEMYVRVYNDNGYIIPNGSVVHVTGSTIGLPKVGRSLASELTYDDLGISTQDIAVSGTGFITTFGMVNDINTTSFLPGDKLYTSATVSGGLTKTPPTAPNRVTPVGWCITAATEGRILVGVKKNTAMGDISNVDEASAVTDDLLVYNSTTGMWNPEQKKGHGHDADQIDYTNETWYDPGPVLTDSNVDAVMTEYNEHLMSTGGSGKITGEGIVYSAENFIVTVSSGTGHIVKNDKHYRIEWDGDVINTYGYTQGLYHVYVDETGILTVSGTAPNTLESIYIGGFYCVNFPGGEGVIATSYNSGINLDNTVSRIANAFYNLGPFVTGGGTVGIMPGETLKIISPVCNVQNVLEEVVLSEASSDDGLLGFWSAYKDITNTWATYGYSDVYEDQNIPNRFYNDTTASGFMILPNDCIFTQGSGIVTCLADITSYINVGDFITSTNMLDTPYAGLVVSGTEWTGSQTNIPLENVYYGTTSTGTTYINRAVAEVPDGKWIKHLIARALDGKMYLFLSNDYFDDETTAIAASLPEIPDFVDEKVIKLAAITIQKGEIDLTGAITDIRPLPFTRQTGGGAGGGGAVVTDHGDLSGLGDDDHSQYFNTSRADARYYTKTQLNAGQLNNQYYTETELDAGQLDNRYYTETELDAGQLDNRYYTETETDLQHIAIVSQIITDHGGLGGLGDDDHTIYTKADGTRDFSAKVSYSAHPTFTTDTEIVDKKYVDDSLAEFIDNLPCLQVRRTTIFAIPGSYADVTFDSTDIENLPSVIEHDNTNTDRINIKEDGLYGITYAVAVSASTTGEAEFRVRKNDTTTLPGSLFEEGSTGGGEGNDNVTAVFFADLINGDFLTLQAQENSGSLSVEVGTTFTVWKMQGSKGDTGATGIPGADGDMTWEGNWTSQNYTTNQAVKYTDGNSYVCHTNTTSSQVPTDTNYWDILAEKGDPGTTSVFGSEFQEASSEGESSTTNSSYQLKIRLTTGTVLAGTYRIGWSYEWISNTTLIDAGYNVDVDSGTIIHEVVPAPTRIYSGGTYYNISGFEHMALSNASHTIDLNYKANILSNGGTTYIRRTRLEIWRVS